MVLEKDRQSTSRIREQTAAVCGGPSCRGKDRAKLCAVLLEAGLSVAKVDCLGVCDGPVAVVPVGLELEVVSRVRSNAERSRLQDAVIRAKRKPIRRNLVRGGTRKKALRRAARSFY